MPASVAISLDGYTAISAAWDYTLLVWNLHTNRIAAQLTGHTNWVTSVAITPDGRLAVSGSRDRTIRVWDLQTYTCIAAYWADARIDCVPGLAF